jgi:transcription-repair coupling factor (superfamily II helicase)
VVEKNNELIREAISREVMRGGQVYYLYNVVEGIEKVCDNLKRLLPEVSFALAHGQMPERALERIMADFYHHRFQVLICTTIIESGIDIPAANTIIMERADRFGLAQLHQLRGRVGRSHHQAYAYLLIPARETLTPEAEQRLEALSKLEELGAGFMLATHDLEIRGAGEILGEGQSGHMQTLGFSLYMEMLEQAVEYLKSGQGTDMPLEKATATEVELKIPSYIPEHYSPDIHTRLILYKRIANAENQAELDALQVEMIDRFGLLPAQAKNLFAITELKLQATSLGIHKIEANAETCVLSFYDHTCINPERILALIKECPADYKLAGPNRLRHLFREPVAAAKLAEAVRGLLEKLVIPTHDTDLK